MPFKVHQTHINDMAKDLELMPFEVHQTHMSDMAKDSERSIENLKEPYVCAKINDWEGFKRFFSENGRALHERIDVIGNTPLHLVASSCIPKLFEELVEMIQPPDRSRVLRIKNNSDNTPLHEVAFEGDVQMAEIILAYDDGLHAEEEEERYAPPSSMLFIRNKLGETPVFRAAALGRTRMLHFFTKQKGFDMRHHFYRTVDKMSILHTAVVDQHFGTAIWLLKQHEALADETEDNGMTTLQLLAKIPSVFKSQFPMGTSKSLIYWLLPNIQEYDHQIHDDSSKGGDLESGQRDRYRCTLVFIKTKKAISRMWDAIWSFLAKEWKGIDELWKRKHMHKLAEDLVELLAEKDRSWGNSFCAKDRTVSVGKFDEPEQGQASKEGQKQILYTPLLMAACTGITEIVEKIIHFHPQAIDHVSEDERNMMFMAVKHRQIEIYQIIKRCRMLRPLAGRIDREGNTVLHCAANFRAGSQPGYALQLQEELRWFQRVQKRIPIHYTMHYNKSNQTAAQLFEQKHAELLKQARSWIKETAQSCSAVAILNATIVFAAIYTAPGGYDAKGLPVFLYSPIFIFFTVMDIVSFAGSLASVVMFLSILTSPCEMWDFRISLPRKLMAGFTLLFFSMATTMLAFSATILLIIQLGENTWTSTVSYIAAFIPVSLFALMQFPLYVAITGCLRHLFKKCKKVIPHFLLNLCQNKKRKTLWEI